MSYRCLERETSLLKYWDQSKTARKRLLVVIINMLSEFIEENVVHKPIITATVTQSIKGIFILVYVLRIDDVGLDNNGSNIDTYTMDCNANLLSSEQHDFQLRRKRWLPVVPRFICNIDSMEPYLVYRQAKICRIESSASSTTSARMGPHKKVTREWAILLRWEQRTLLLSLRTLPLQ